MPTWSGKVFPTLFEPSCSTGAARDKPTSRATTIPILHEFIRSPPLLASCLLLGSMRVLDDAVQLILRTLVTVLELALSCCLLCCHCLRFPQESQGVGSESVIRILAVIPLLDLAVHPSDVESARRR